MAASTVVPTARPRATTHASVVRRTSFRNDITNGSSTCRIAKTRPVYLLRPLPEIPVDASRAIARAAQLGCPASLAAVLSTYHQRQAFIWAAQDKVQSACGAHLLNPLPYLCDGQFRQGADADRPRYYDDNHLTETGNRRLVPLFAGVFGNALPSFAVGAIK